MNRRWSIICAAIGLAMVIGGAAATVPLIQALYEANARADRAPTPDLEVSRQAVLETMQRTLMDISRRADSLEALGGLLADAGAKRGQPVLVSTEPKQ